jgi:hypothetical protein
MAQAAKGELLGDDPLQPLAIERPDRIYEGPIRCELSVALAGASQNLVDWSDRELADALARLDQPGKGTKQCHLLVRVPTVAVGHAAGANDFVATFPRSKPSWLEPRQHRHLMNLVGSLGLAHGVPG